MQRCLTRDHSSCLSSRLTSATPVKKELSLETGSYVVYFFNRYGTKLKDSTQAADSLLAARSLGVEVLSGAEGFDKMHKPVSFAVDRRIYNSLDSQD